MCIRDRKWFRPELAGRLDEMIVFRPLADDSLCAIAEKMLCQLEQRAARLGADAVVGIDVDYEVLGSNNGMLMVTVSGTAVTLR